MKQNKLTHLTQKSPPKKIVLYKIKYIYREVVFWGSKNGLNGLIGFT